MAKQLNVNLAFTADTSKAKQQLQELQSQLNNLITNSKVDLNLEQDLRGAVKHAAELSTHLHNATNVNTGNLDFAKFNRSIKQSGSSLNDYAQSLRKLGPDGQKAFMSLAQSVATAEIPIRRSNALIKELGTTLANTARWQLSSSMLHGFMGAMQSAYGYAQDLNESLNNIRIVTGANIDQMAAFAQEANKAAKALSTTTTQYTNASLIYYQQGLNDSEVKERTDITVKMANVARESAQTVSDQMTAVWNNFYDGSKSLEHYADVMTALGAATASSTSEISTGLNKFASVAETVGLSYEYAASALATVTATTRQSADVVGTAFKTLFARIQDLELGKTLDDGTTLGTYSESLAKVGIQIKDTSGEMKSMDVILEEMASRWQTLAKDQQVALAQSVAGVRQYTQLIALMDNWDFMEQNLATAKNSEGALQAQADIYAESWEAAQNRVKAAAEKIYDALLNDEFFIDVLNSIEKILSLVDYFIDSLGGLRGVLASLGAIVTKVFSNQISQGLTNMAYNLKMMTKAGREAEEQSRRKFIDDAVNSIPQNKEYTTDVEKAQQDSMRTQLTLQQEYMANADRMNNLEAETNKKLMDRARILRESVVVSEQQKEKASKNVDENVNDILTDVAGYNMSTSDPKAKINVQEVHEYIAAIKKAAEYQDILATSGQKAFAALSSEPEKAQGAMQELAAALNGVKLDAASLGTEGVKSFQALQGKIKEVASAKSPEELERALEELNQELEILSKNSGFQLKDLVSPGTAKKVDSLTGSLREKVKAQRESADAAKAAAEAEKEASESIKNAKGNQMEWSDILVKSANLAFSAASAFSMLGSMVDTLKNPDATGWEKFLAVLTTLGMVIPTLVSVWSTLKSLISTETVVKLANAAATAAQVVAEKALNKEKGKKSNPTTKKSIKETIEDTKQKIQNTKNKFNDKVWDGLDDKARQKYTDDALRKKGYTPNSKGTGWKLGQGKEAAKSAKGALSNADAAKMVQPDAKALAGKAGMKSIASKAGAFAVAAVIIAGAVVAINKLNEAYNQNEIAAQKAEAAAKTLGEAYNEAKTKYSELTNTISNYNNIQDNISGLTRGTVEFAEAISSANDEAMSLLDTYGDIIGNRYSVDSDGLIKIDEEALKDVQKTEMDKVQQAQSASIIARQQAREAREVADATEFHRKEMKTKEGFTKDDMNRTGVAAAGGAAVGAGAAAVGAAMGATIGSTVPIVGTLIGAGIGLLAGAVVGAIGEGIAKNSETDAEKEALASLAEDYKNNGESALTKEKIAEAYGVSVDDLTEEQISAIRELCQEMRANTLATEAENQAMANQILSDNEKVQNSRDAEDVGVFAGAAYGKATDEAMQKYMSDDYKAGFFGKGSDAQKDAWARYAEAQGLGDLKDYKVTDYRKDGGVEYSYTDEEGKTQKKVISQEEWAAVVAAQDADAAVNEAGEKIVDILNKLQEGTVDILTGAKSGDMSGLTMGQLADTNNQELQNMSEADLQALGFEGTKEEILSQIAEQQKANIDNIKLYAGEYGSAVSGLINNMIDTNDATIQNVTQGTLKAYADTLNNLALHGGADVMTNFDTGLQGIMDKYSNKSEEIMSLANNIDWSAGEDALQDFNYQLMKIGINIDEGSAEWQSLVTAMQSMNTSVIHRDFDSLRAQIAEIKELCGDIEIGDVISDEEFDKLIKYKAELADLFIMTADGYKYIGGGNLSDMAGEAALEQLENTKADNEKARAAHDAINNWGWTDGTNFTKEDWYGLANGTDSNTSMNAMTNALLQNESEHITNMGYDTAYLQEMSDLLLSGNEEQQKAAKEILQQFYQDVLTMNDNYEAGMYEDTKAEEVYASTATNIDELNAMSGAFEDGKNSEAYTKQLQYLTNAGIAAAESLSELYSIMGQGLENGATIDYSTYADALIRIGEGYSNTSAELGRYQQALESGNQEQINATQASLEAAIQAGEMAEQYGLTAEHIERYADELQASGKYAKANEKALTNMAKDQLRFDKAVNKAADNMETWIKDLKVAEKTGHLVSESADGMAEAYGDLLDIDGSELSSEFLKNTKNLEDMQKALEGDEEAYKRLQEAARKDIATRIGIDDAEFQSKFANLMSQYYQGQSLDDIEVGAALDNADFLQGLTDMVNAAGMTAQEATDYLSSMGVDAEVVTEPETVEEVQGYNLVAHTSTTPVSYTGAASDGTPQTLQASYPTVTYTTEPVTTTKTVAGTALKVTSASKSSGGGVKHSGSTTANGGSNSSGSGGGGGGSSKPTSDSRGKKTDIVDRYKQVDDKLDDVRNRMDQASKAADRLWGPARLKQMNEVNKSIEQEIDLLKDKKKEADDYLIEDQQALDTAAGDLGISFEYDKDGNIKNYEAQMTEVYEAREALLDSFGSEMNESEQEQLADFDEKVEALKDAISQYDETRELSEDLANEIQDKIYEWQDNNYEMLNVELEFKLEIEDSKLELVEYYLGKIEDDVYATAEAFGHMNSLVDGYTNKLAAQEDYVKKLEEDYKAGRISMDAYKEGLRESQSATIENLQALQEQKEAMQDYYGNVMEMALEEIALYTDEMEELNSVLDHYSNILELVGKQEDYATKGKVLNAKATNLRNEMQVQQKLYEESSAEAEKWAAKMATAVEGSNEYETYKKNWIAAQEAANEAQDAMLSKTEEWAEAIKAVVENELAGLAKTMEESLTGGTSFDELLTSMERRSSLQEEYLTTTNQIYETNKLMRQAQQEIDKSSNSVAKRKLQNFINETAQMQEQSELSQYELDIQQAKYDLLLAEIALEEAQNAKSTVRLQRDSEGNFGYVYTADQSAVGEAEQNLADKQNALYNLGLEGANDYSQKYAETMQEAQDAITELTEMWMNGEIQSEEEYQRRKAEIQDYYYEKLKQYSSLYQVALTTDSNVIKDAWSTDFSDMIYKTEDWKVATDDYFAGAAESMQTWAEVCGTVLEESGLDDVEKTVGNITTKSEELKKTLIGEDGESGVVGAMMSEAEAAGELSESYIKIQDEIDRTIEKYEKLLGKLNEDYTDPTTPEVDPAIDNEDEKDTDDKTTDNTDTEDKETPPSLTKGSRVEVKSGTRWYADSYGGGSSGKAKGGTIKYINTAGSHAYNIDGLGWVKKTDIVGYDTGGYTGDWDGAYGKLAMLHKKELILNANDTENFLAGMDLLDKIVSAIDLYSMNSQLGGALASPSLGNMGGGEVLEQQVHIEASFPGVQDRSEIEEAFNTLINRASQYANRK